MIGLFTRSSLRGMAPRIAATLLLGSSLLACVQNRPLVDREPQGEPGLPASVSRIVIPLGGGAVVDCTGTLIHERWVLTSAHCFSAAPAESFATIRALGASVRIDEVWVHPDATFEAGPIAGEYMNWDIVAAHDLALMPLRFAVTDQPIATLWEPGLPTVEALADLEVSYGRTYAGDPYTVVASVDGLVDASQLLDGEQPDELLAATGPAPRAGDSGGGAFRVSSGNAQSRLVGVVQDSPVEGGFGRFGLVPLWLESHRRFIDEALASPLE